MMQLETVAIVALVLGLLLAILGGRFHTLQLIAAGLFAVSLISIVGYVGWLRFGAPMSGTATCYDSTIIDCGFGFERNQFMLGHALFLVALFLVINIGGLAIVFGRRYYSRLDARV